MGIDIECGEHQFRCSYGRWNDLRVGLIRASYEYLKNYKSTDPDLSEYETKYQEELLTFLENTLKTEKYNIAAFVDGCNLHFLNLLIHFGLAGLYALCNKSDDDGYYSVGNAYDICELFKVIIPYITNDHHNQYLKQITEIFVESVEKKQLVVLY